MAPVTKSWISLSPKQYRRRVPLLRLAVCAFVAVLLLAVGGWILGRPPAGGRVTVYEPKTGHRIVPSRLGRATALLACPCPAPAPSANGNPGSPAEFGATAKVQLGKFTYGAD